MKTVKKLVVSIIALSAMQLLQAQVDEPRNIASSKISVSSTNVDYQLVWEDNFDGNTLNTNNWVVEVNGNGGGNNELQYYRSENVSVGIEPVTGANCLILTAKKENYLGKVCTSGRLNTLGKVSFKYGKIVARIKLPKTANGLWPAFWMMGQDYPQVGWPKCGEIDILEMGNANGISRGTQERYFNSWFHWGESWNGGAYPNWGKDYTHPTGIQDGFYLFTLIWDENTVKTYFGTDEEPMKVQLVEMGIKGADVAGNVGRYFHKRFFVIFNLAIGGNFTGITGNSNISKITALDAGDAKMYVDYVRVYQKGDANEEYSGPILNTLIDNFAAENKFRIYPNPVSGLLTVETINKPLRIQVISLTGKEIMSVSNENIIDTSMLPPGNYLVKIEDSTGRTETHKLTKK